LQDSNSLVMKTDDLAEILRFIREKFPEVRRITSYCRSLTAAKKTVEELKMLREAGLSRIHVGMESGYDPLLKFIRKGATAEQHIEGGRRIVTAGISLSEYVMPGLGGVRWTGRARRRVCPGLESNQPCLHQVAVPAGAEGNPLVRHHEGWAF